MLLGASFVGNMEEANLILCVGKWNMDILVESVILRTEVSKDEFGILSLGPESIAVNEGGWWSRLLLDPLDDGVLSSSTSVFLLLTRSK